MTQILLVDPQQLSREALCRVLDSDGNITVLACTTDYEASVVEICRHEIDIVIIDVSVVDEPMAVIADLKQIRPAIRTLALAGTGEVAGALQALGAGVEGYITKLDDSDTLLAAIRSIAAGTRYICPAVGWQLAMNLLQAYPGTVLH